MIPERVHRDLPGDLAWIITEKHVEGHRRLVVYLAADVRPDSPLEQHFVRQATRAWRNHRRRVLFPGLIAAPGAWAGRHPKLTGGIGTGAAVGCLALGAAITLTGPDQHHRPSVAVAPPAAPTTRPPHHTPTPDRPGHPSPSPTGPAASASPPVKGEGGSPSTPPTPPPDTQPATVEPTGPPVIADPPPPGQSCRLVKLHVGRLVRVCL